VSAPPLPSLPGVDHRFVEAGGLRFHVAEAGDPGAPVLLMLHGWPQHWWMWRKILPEISRTYRCIAPDLRGLGWTDAPRSGYDKRQLALDVLALMDELGLDTVRLVGHDWGAVAGLHLCREAPERVSKFLMLSVPAPWDTQPDPRKLLGIAHMPLLSAPFAEHIVAQLTWQLLRLSGFSREDAEPYLSVISQPERRRATVAYYRTFTTRELPAMLTHPPERPDVPIRLIGGDRDPVCRFSPSVEKVRGAGHFLPEDKPDAVIGHVKSFLEPGVL
jgi:pimeloyl-ACP methyl ester carboxylesterase